MTTNAQAKYNAKPETKKNKHDWYVANKERLLAEERDRYASDPEFAEKKKGNSKERYSTKKVEVQEHNKLPRSRELKAASDAKHYSKNGVQVRKANRNNRNMDRYGLSTEQIDQMIADRHGLCDICHKKPKRLNVDHDHATGEVRGMLCWNCNVGIGKLGDTVEGVKAALAYLEG